MEQWTGSCYLIILNDKFEVIDNIMNSFAFKILRMQNTMNWATLRFFCNCQAFVDLCHLQNINTLKIKVDVLVKPQVYSFSLIQIFPEIPHSPFIFQHSILCCALCERAKKGNKGAQENQSPPTDCLLVPELDIFDTIYDVSKERIKKRKENQLLHRIVTFQLNWTLFGASMT